MSLFWKNALFGGKNVPAGNAASVLPSWGPPGLKNPAMSQILTSSSARIGRAGRRQASGGRRQASGSRCQASGSRRQAGRREAAGRPKSGGAKKCSWSLWGAPGAPPESPGASGGALGAPKGPQKKTGGHGALGAPWGPCGALGAPCGPPLRCGTCAKRIVLLFCCAVELRDAQFRRVRYACIA